MNLKLSALSRRELEKLEADIKQELEARHARRMIAAAEGRDPDVAEHTVIVPIKYRHPVHSDKTWTGRGRAPNWFVECLDSGFKKADLLVA